MAKKKRIPQCSRRDRYYNSISDVQSVMKGHEEIVAESMSAIRVSIDTLYNSLEELKGVMSEYEEWRDIMADSGRLNRSHKATYEKLMEIIYSKDSLVSSMSDVDYSIEEAGESLSLSDFRKAIDEAENLELPIGFVRD